MIANAIGAPAERACSRCGSIKPMSDYHRKGSRFHSACKACISVEKKVVYKKKKRAQRCKGIRQIQLDELKIMTTVYAGDLPSPTFEEHLNLLRSFVLEDVICDENRTSY